MESEVRLVNNFFGSCLRCSRKSAVAIAWLAFFLGACSSLENVQTRIPNPYQSASPAPVDGPILEKEIESGLTNLGYNSGTPDGLMDVRSEMAIQEFQLDNNLTIDGKVSTALLDQIRLQLANR